MKYEDLIEDCVDESSRDVIALGQIPSHVRYLLNIHDPDAIRSKSLEIIRSLINRGVFPGDLRRVGFSFWPGTPAELIKRIEDAWIALKRTPDLDDICWFGLKPPANV